MAKCCRLANKIWMMEKQRIDKFISNQLGLSRNDTRTGIKRGKAVVNGFVQKDISYQVIPETDKISYDGNEIKYKKFIYIMLNKPAGVISASSDSKHKTVLDLVPKELYRRGHSAVGRLDKDTTGLIIITDDGEFAHKCISPKSKIEKSYIADLDGDINADIIKKFKDGIVLANGYKCKPAILECLKEHTVRVIITEGKYHQIKRMFGVVGLGVNHLHRERIGSLILPENLNFGECKELDKMAIKKIF